MFCKPELKLNSSFHFQKSFRNIWGDFVNEIVKHSQKDNTMKLLINVDRVIESFI